MNKQTLLSLIDDELNKICNDIDYTDLLIKSGRLEIKTKEYLKGRNEAFREFRQFILNYTSAIIELD